MAEASGYWSRIKSPKTENGSCTQSNFRVTGFDKMKTVLRICMNEYERIIALSVINTDALSPMYVFRSKGSETYEHSKEMLVKSQQEQRDLVWELSTLPAT